MISNDNMTVESQEKKLRGSGGHVMAKVNDEEQKLANLGGPELFLAGIGRLEESRFSKYFCNKCEKDYEGAPAIVYENPNEDLGEGIMLIEKGEYRCKQCENTIAQYRKFENIKDNEKKSDNDEKAEVILSGESSKDVSTTEYNKEEFISVDSLIGVSAYDNNAILVGKVKEIGLLKSQVKGKKEIGFRLIKENNLEAKIVSWNEISKIGDIILLTTDQESDTDSFKCKACGYKNELDSMFCEECGSKLK